PRQRAAVAAALENVQPSLRAARIQAYKTFRTLPLVATTVNREQLLSLMTSSDVASVSLVQRERKLDTPKALEAAQLTTSVASIDVLDAWARGFDGTGYAIAVIDDGFNVAHPMLTGKNTGDACFGSDFGTTTRNNCPSGVSPQIGAGAASKCPAGVDRCNHGTHVASIAVGNDGVNFGVARGAKLVPIDVFSTETDSAVCDPDPAPCQLTDSLAVLDALDYVNEHAADLKIAAVNLSLGGSARDGYCDEDPRKGVIDMLRQKGIAVAASAGNEGLTGKITAPACISTAMAVGATDDGTTVASFSNFSSVLDFMAPGVAVRAASNPTGLVSRSGTSMAAPHLAGAWAVLRSAFPAGALEQMESALKDTGTAVTRAASRVSVPKIQVGNAIDRLQGKDKRNFNNLLSSNAFGLGESYLRFFNDSDADGTVTVTFRDVNTGATLGAWTGAVKAHAAPQIPVSALETLATPATGQLIALPTRPYYNADIASTFPGYMQHVIWSRGGGVFANVSSCATGFSADATTVSNVHVSPNVNYPSRLRIVNSGAITDHAVLTMYSIVDGSVVGTWTSPDIAPNGSLDIKSSVLEDQTASLKAAVTAGLPQYSIKLANLNGYLQHVVENRLVGAVVDMSAKCALNGSTPTATVAAPPSGTGTTAFTAEISH
ncbi:MAG: S8 family serine peptidase, partial [Rhodospirillaceae bacterium]|nr:S8 family serine peptidase [Rhodospirillaceae bacterium]